MTDEQFIRNQIRRILFEETEEPDSDSNASDRRVTRGRIGAGRVAAKIEAAQALANKDPMGLMKKLNVSTASGSTTIEKVFSVLKQAMETLKSTEGLEEAYEGVTLSKSPSGEDYIRIKPKGISERNAVLYALHILTGAENAEILKGLDKEVVVGKTKSGDKAVVIFKDL